MNTTCQYTHDDGHVCGAQMDTQGTRRKYCPACVPLSIERHRKERLHGTHKTNRVRMSVEPKPRKPSPDMAERYARIKAQYGAPGMGISPNTRSHAIKAWKL